MINKMWHQLGAKDSLNCFIKLVNNMLLYNSAKKGV